MIKDKKQIKEILKLLDEIASQYKDEVKRYELADDRSCNIHVGRYESALSCGSLFMDIRDGSLDLSPKERETIYAIKIKDNLDEKIDKIFEDLKYWHRKNFEEGVIAIQNLKRILK